MHEKMIKDIIMRMSKTDVEKLGEAFINTIDMIKLYQPDMYEEAEMRLYTALNGYHFNEDLAKKAVDHMVYPMPEYNYSHSPEQIEQSIKQIYQQAIAHMSKYGKKANPIPTEVTKWDMYYVYHMICADYSLSHGGDNSKILMMAYEFISDPDATPCKAYNYYCAMKKRGK